MYAYRYLSKNCESDSLLNGVKEIRGIKTVVAAHRT